jgi:SAM-dependent methyltransferase
MHIGAIPDSLLERIALELNKVPMPVGHAVYGMPTARAVTVAQTTGIFGRLAREPAGVAQLTRELELAEPGTRMLLEVLVDLGHVAREGDGYALSKSARPWLDPESDTYCGTFIEHTDEYWEWWGDLDRIVRTGDSFELHSRGADDPRWRTYITGQYELARLSAPEVARAIKLRAGAASMLDVAGGHGWFSAELCRRNEGLRAVVVDLPGSAAVGREIIAAAGMSDRVRHVEGDMFEADLGSGHDLVLCFNIIHHLEPDSIVKLFRRAGDALAPGGTIAVLDLFVEPGGRFRGQGAILGLFFYLSSAAATYSPQQLSEYLREAGFDAPKQTRIRRIPDQSLYRAVKA